MPNVYAVDFDGTLCTNEYPDIGEPNQDIIDLIRALKDEGHRIILWTCRNGDKLQVAIDWCADQGIAFDCINENTEANIDEYGEDTRKVAADYYIDDRAVNIKAIRAGAEVRTRMAKPMTGQKDRTVRQARSQATNFRAISAGDERYIEGYFAVFDGEYELWPGATESVDPGAFDDALTDDVRALIDHETRLVIGRNTAKTLELKVDDHGLWGKISINGADQDALNLYARVERGDVNQCSFGFDILEEEVITPADGTIHWTIKKVKLYEVSVVTFPAYQDTSVTARKQEYRQIITRQHAAWQEKMKARIRTNGT